MTLSDDTRRSASVAGCVRFVCLQDRIDSRRQRPWAGRHIARVKEGARVPGADATLCERRKRRLSPADRVCRRVVRCQCADRTPPRRVQIHGHCSAATSQKRTCCSPFVWDHTHSMTTEGGHCWKLTSATCLNAPTHTLWGTYLEIPANMPHRFDLDANQTITLYNPLNERATWVRPVFRLHVEPATWHAPSWRCTPAHVGRRVRRSSLLLGHMRRLGGACAAVSCVRFGDSCTS